MSYLDLAAALVKRLEGYRLIGYADSVGKPTNGYGHTGPEVRVGVSITQEIADHNLTVDLATADRELRACIKPAAIPNLHEHEMAALVSFVFNVGANASWTIWKDINAGKLGDVPAQLRRFDHGEVGGKLVVIPGLNSRREAEVAFWNTADTAQAAAIMAAAPIAPPPSSYTRSIPTPPAPTPAPPLATQSIVTKAVTMVAGAATAAGTLGSQVHDIAAPHAAEAPIFSTLAVIASGLVVAAALVGLLIHAEQAKQRAV